MRRPRCRQLIAIQLTGINGLIPAWQSLLGILAIVKGARLAKVLGRDRHDALRRRHAATGALLARSFVERRGEAHLRLARPCRHPH